MSALPETQAINLRVSQAMGEVLPPRPKLWGLCLLVQRSNLLAAGVFPMWWQRLRVLEHDRLEASMPTNGKHWSRGIKIEMFSHFSAPLWMC